MPECGGAEAEVLSSWTVQGHFEVALLSNGSNCKASPPSLSVHTMWQKRSLPWDEVVFLCVNWIKAEHAHQSV